MSRDQDFNDDNIDDVPAKKNAMTVEKFLNQFKTLDSSNYGGWPLSVKITVWLLILIAVCALGFFLVVRGLTSDIDKALSQQQVLLNEFRDKDSKLRNLQQYETQLKAVEANFSQQLEQLPKESEIPGLVEDINMTGVNAGLKFNGITLDQEIIKEFFIEQPIKITAVGDYHAFGSFTSALAALPRIVTLHDFTIASKQAKPDDVPTVEYSITAKTYRYDADLIKKADEKSKENADEKSDERSSEGDKS